MKVIGLTASASRDDEGGLPGRRHGRVRAQADRAGAPGRGDRPRLRRDVGRPASAPASAAVPAEAIDPAALAALDAALGAGTAAEIVAAFLADAPARLARMRALAAGGAAGPLAREAHALAGSAGTLGLRALAAAARSLETGLAGSAADLPARLAPLEALADERLPGWCPNGGSRTKSWPRLTQLTGAVQARRLCRKDRPTN